MRVFVQDMLLGVHEREGYFELQRELCEELMERQEVEREEHGKGVRRPRSDALRRPRPASGLVSAPAADAHPGSHASYDSYREPPQSEHPGSGYDRRAERRPGDRYVDVRGLSLVEYLQK